jgi:chorismate mutase
VPHLLVLFRVLAVVVAVGAIGVSGPTVAAAGSAAPAPTAALGDLADLVVERIALADLVAAAKFGTGEPIDDPAREHQVLDTVAAAAPGAGVDPDEAQRFFRDQIEANKVVQRGLHARWTAHPELRPTERPDLAAQVRPELDRLTTALLEGLRDSAPVRHAPDGCDCDHALARATSDAGADLDALHREALGVALRSVCPAS